VATSITLEEGVERRKEISLAASPLNPRRSYVPAILCFIGGGLGIGATVLTGVLASQNKDSGLWAATAVAATLGGVGVGAGASLLLVRSSGSTGAPTSEIAVRAAVGPGSLTLTGTF
jgi:hypothetical protein